MELDDALSLFADLITVSAFAWGAIAKSRSYLSRKPGGNEKAMVLRASTST